MDFRLIIPIHLCDIITSFIFHVRQILAENWKKEKILISSQVDRYKQAEVYMGA
jgi:hypothetical protein